MKNKNISFGIIGGDKRQIELINDLAKDNYTVYAYGFEKIEKQLAVSLTGLCRAIKRPDFIILPVPVTINSNALNSPYSDQPILIDDNFLNMLKGKIVFCGVKKRLDEISPKAKNIIVYDYSAREDFAQGNAIPTAEGALEVAMQEYKATLNGSNCLISGFGRIGKVLSKMLDGIGANVSVLARSPKALKDIQSKGYIPLDCNNLDRQLSPDIIFNTVPQQIFKEDLIKMINGTPIFIELASAPGGIAEEIAKNSNIKLIKAPALPGKVAPITAAKVIKQSIFNILEEEKLWKK